MRIFVLLVLLAAGPAWADSADMLCASNPAFSPDVMLRVVQVELQGDHDPSLDADTPEHIANQASTQGIAECAAEVRSDPSVATALGGLTGSDLQAGWDSYNTACADRKVSRGACITADVDAGKALKRMVKEDEPTGAKSLVQTCPIGDEGDRGECRVEAVRRYGAGGACLGECREKMQAVGDVACSGEWGGGGGDHC